MYGLSFTLKNKPELFLNEIKNSEVCNSEKNLVLSTNFMTKLLLLAFLACFLKRHRSIAFSLI